MSLRVLTSRWCRHGSIWCWIDWPGFQGLFNPANPIGMLVGVKLLLLAATTALGVNARLRLFTNLSNDNLTALAWHIRAITALAPGFLGCGAELPALAPEAVQ
ncbi:MAG: hypothetical protein VKN17_01150 [Cyanobacteriota bacterium]|nr:hypothetical protein [Cyanobacteriota bacterium]